MKKGNKIFVVVGVIILVGVYVGLIISNIYLQQQLDKKNEIINELIVTNEFMEDYLDVVKTDSTHCLVVRVDRQGNRQTYKDMRLEVDRLERELEIKDQLFVLAKHRYHFNVRYKMEGDSLLKYTFYDKSSTTVEK